MKDLSLPVKGDGQFQLDTEIICTTSLARGPRVAHVQEITYLVKVKPRKPGGPGRPRTDILNEGVNKPATVLWLSTTDCNNRIFLKWHTKNKTPHILRRAHGLTFWNTQNHD